MTGTIKSSTLVASSAVSQLTDTDLSHFQQQTVEFGYTSEISGMENGRQAANCLLTTITNFSQAVLLQANKFPEIAQKIAKKDVELAKRWENSNDQ